MIMSTERELREYKHKEQILELGDIMPFGKYKGWLVRDILADDAGYLRWFIANVSDVGLASEIEDALENEALRQELIEDSY